MAESESKRGTSPSPPPDGALGAQTYEAEDVFENAEPWDPIETKLVIGSFIAAAIFLGLFSILIPMILEAFGHG